MLPLQQFASRQLSRLNRPPAGGRTTVSCRDGGLPRLVAGRLYGGAGTDKRPAEAVADQPAYVWVAGGQRGTEPLALADFLHGGEYEAQPGRKRSLRRAKHLGVALSLPAHPKAGGRCENGIDKGLAARFAEAGAPGGSRMPVPYPYDGRARTKKPGLRTEQRAAHGGAEQNPAGG